MILHYFKTNRSLMIQYNYEDLKMLQWMGDKKVKEFCDSWKLLKSGRSTRRGCG